MCAARKRQHGQDDGEEGDSVNQRLGRSVSRYFNIGQVESTKAFIVHLFQALTGRGRRRE